MEIYLNKLAFLIIFIPLALLAIISLTSGFRDTNYFYKKNELTRFCLKCKKPFIVNQKREIKNCPRCKRNTTSISVN
tara:strand:+ start:518 stop:748 length:231 start_codon:yes stop_codon:yes gene_type:complete